MSVIAWVCWPLLCGCALLALRDADRALRAYREDRVPQFRSLARWGYALSAAAWTVAILIVLHG
jgi:hypothetical protein